jgi:hypothetical protein
MLRDAEDEVGKVEEEEKLMVLLCSICSQLKPSYCSFAPAAFCEPFTSIRVA